MSTEPVPIRAFQPPVEAYDDDVDLREYLLVVWQRRWLIGIVTAVCVATAALMTWTSPKMYEASVTLLASPSKIGEPALGSSVPSLRVLLQNRGVAERVIKEFSLSAPPYGLTAASFVDDAVRVEDIEKTNIVQAKVTLRDSPDLAARVANRLADRAVELNREMNQQDNLAARDFIKEQLDAARATLDRLEGQLVTEQQHAELGAVEADADDMLANRSKIAKLAVEVEGEKARLASAERELSHHQRIVPVPRAVDSAAAMIEAGSKPAPVEPVPQKPSASVRSDSRESVRSDAPVSTRDRELGRQASKKSPANEKSAASKREPEQPPERSALALAVEQAAPSTVTSSPELNLRSEFINPVYEALEYQIATSRTRLASLEAEQMQLRRAGATSSPTLARMYSRQATVARLRTEYDLAKQTYLDLATQYAQARIQVASRTSQLQVIDPAVPASRPVSPRPARNLAIALVVGLFGGAMLALGIRYLSSFKDLTPSATGGRSRPQATS
jgi:uncharacterized protein involved in exopolysaccharide biosynthesis